MNEDKTIADLPPAVADEMMLEFFRAHDSCCLYTWHGGALHKVCVRLEQLGKIRRSIEEPERVGWELVPC